MPAKSNPVHMDAFPSLYRLMEQAKAMSQDATRKPLSFEQQHTLTRLAIAALKASGVSSGEIESEIKSQFNHLVPQGLKPSPASQEITFDPIPVKSAEPVVVATQPEKKRGIF